MSNIFFKSSCQIGTAARNVVGKKLREAMPGIGLVQAIHVTSEEAFEEAFATASHVNGILLDSGNQTLKVKQLGRTGQTHEWSISRRIREKVNTPNLSGRRTKS